MVSDLNSNFYKKLGALLRAILATMSCQKGKNALHHLLIGWLQQKLGFKKADTLIVLMHYVPVNSLSVKSGRFPAFLCWKNNWHNTVKPV